MTGQFTVHSVSDPAATVPLMTSSTRHQHDPTAPVVRVGLRCGSLAALAAVSMLTGCSPTNPPRMVSTTVTAHAPNAGVSTTAPQPISTPPHVPVAASGLLADIPQVPKRKSLGDYRRAAFGDAWTDDQDAPGGHNGCDTRNDILDRDLINKTYTSISRCPKAVATGTLHDPYTGMDIAFTRGNQVGAAVQIDHIVPLAYAWDMGAREWTPEIRTRFANDPANLLAVEGKSNQGKSDKEPAKWMPANTAYHCEYLGRFTAVLRAYGLPIDVPSSKVIDKAAPTCPTS